VARAVSLDRTVPAATSRTLRAQLARASSQSRPHDLTPKPLMTSPTVVSLYSGAGGLDLGFIEAGYDIVWANDLDSRAAETYRDNIGQHMVPGALDVGSIPSWLRGADLVIGGPPCQGFSVAGHMAHDDPRSEEVHRFLDAVERIQPAGFVMENVKTLATAPRWAQTRGALVQRARELGFQTCLAVLDASQFGVPQARERMFLIGLRGIEPPLPQGLPAPTPYTVREAVNALPRYGQPGNDTICAARVVPAKRPVMRPSWFQGSLLFNGSGRPIHLDRPAKTLPASMGGNATPIIDQGWLDGTHQPWVDAYHRYLRRGGDPKATAPRRLRRLTVEEAAILQSFPVGFRFHGPRQAQYRHIGNAVPPRLAFHVARALLPALNELRDGRLRAGGLPPRSRRRSPPARRAPLRA